MKKLKVLDLFSGTQSIAKAFRKQGHETYTIDFNPIFSDTDWHVDLIHVTAQDILERFGKPDIIWASPPCTKFSVAAIGRNWTKINEYTFEPKNEETKQAMELVKHTLALIKELQPSFFFIENPRGMLRKLSMMQEFNRHSVTYCQYGDFRMKPTDLWTNHPNPNFKAPCKNGDPCHVSAPRGSRTGTQGLKDAIERAKLPEELCDYICQICEEEIGKITS